MTAERTPVAIAAEGPLGTSAAQAPTTFLRPAVEPPASSAALVAGPAAAQIPSTVVVRQPVKSGTRADIRSRLAARLTRLEAEQPEVVDLLADVHAAIYAHLHGRASALHGPHSPRKWRDILLGDRSLSVFDICRLATSPHPWARAAAAAAVRVMAAAVGARLVAEAGERSVEPHEALAGVMESVGTFGAEMSRGLRDGALTPEEARELRPEIDDVRAQVARAEAVVTAAERRGRDGGRS